MCGFSLKVFLLLLWCFILSYNLGKPYFLVWLPLAWGLKLKGSLPPGISNFPCTGFWREVWSDKFLFLLLFFFRESTCPSLTSLTCSLATTSCLKLSCLRSRRVLPGKRRSPVPPRRRPCPGVHSGRRASSSRWGSPPWRQPHQQTVIPGQRI